MRSIKSRAWVEEVETYHTAEGFGIILDCRTPEMKRFSVTLRCGTRAHEKSVAGRNMAIIERMLDYVGMTTRDLERSHYDWKTSAARVRHGFFWFKLDVDNKSIFLRDVRPCDPFPVFDPVEDMEAACAALEALVAEQEASYVP
jgi:hypothetical protein